MTAALRLGLALTILILALGAVALAVDRWAPPQHLPWKPLTLDQPIGLATHWKIARLAAGPPDACRAVLAAGGVRFRPAANVIRTGFCATEGAGRVAAGLPGLNPPGAAMTCGETLALAVWLRRSVEPAAREAFHAEVGGLDHFGTYACRAVRGGGPASQHASANAIDVAAIRLADGRKISVLGHYQEGGPRGRFLHAIHQDACRVFAAALGPNYNASHRDHLHLDLGPWRACR